MSGNILHDLYNGQFNAWSRRSAGTVESKAVRIKIDDENRYFMQKMSPDDCRRFEELDNLYFKYSDFEQADAFSYGFRLGTILMCAVYSDDSALQCDE